MENREPFFGSTGTAYHCELSRGFAPDKDSTQVCIAQGIRWADEECRVSGTLSMALRRATAQQAADLVDLLIRYGAKVPNDVPRIMNRYYYTVLKVLDPERHFLS